MRRSAGTLGLGRNRSHAERPAVEVTAGNGKPETTRLNEDEPTSPGNSFRQSVVDKRILPFPAVPGRSRGLNPNRTYIQLNVRVLNAWQFINDAVMHPSRPSDDFIVPRAVRLLRHG